MTLATLTTKGQVTIPKNIRESLKLQAGDKIEFLLTKNEAAMIRPVTKKVDDLFCRLRQPNQKPVTVEEMNNAIKNRMKDKFK